MSFHTAVDEQQRPSNNTPLPSRCASPDAGGYITGHAHRGTQRQASSSSLSNEGATDTTAASSAVDGARQPAPATAAAAVGAPSQRRAFSALRCPVHHRCHSPTSSRHDLDSVVEEFLKKATNDADVPPGLLRFLQVRRNHQRQRQQAQLRPLAHSPLGPTLSVNSVRNGAQRAPPPQSWAVPSHGPDSATSRKAATAPMAANSNDDNVLFHDYSSGTVGRQLCWLSEAVAPGSPSGLAEEDEEKDTTLSATGGGGNSAHARPRPTTATATTVKQLEAHMFHQRRYSTVTDVCEGVRGGDSFGDGATACFDSAASLIRLQRAYQPLSSTATVSSSHSPAPFGFLGSQPCPQPEGVPRALQESGSPPLRRTSSGTGRAHAVPIHKVAGVLPHPEQPREPHQPPHNAQNRSADSPGAAEAAVAVVNCGGGDTEDTYQSTSSASLIPSPLSLMPSAQRGITTSASARFTASSARQLPHVVNDADWRSRSGVPPAPLLQLSLAAPRASSRLSVSARFFGGATTANTTILGNASITDVPHANLPSSVAATCGMLAPTTASADWGSFGSLGMSSVQLYQHQPRFRLVQTGGASNHSSSATKSTGAEAATAAAAVSLFDVTAGSVSGRMSSYGEMEPSLTAGVTWIGQLFSYAASVTSLTTGTFTSTTNYCCSGASNSMTV
ncbi:hypothetical protein LMXM_04_0720 [Leishmania mexicana MHOM/GT/2001/U1103]|uniref:Uncharacterized protein n=1 Tax=Leishmania mexicana (strain MHOM/GT/2001/U1103) TaxID=929439 RepID=E9AK55_LEIMU|nr:hypothetical protein LMXM_04_0720 [Leishmania mexicana MHOM/GT/2001/U1103]CBZ23305.1 hypothetical protein LMXM_04_0720 [Leishmania mexicana MHOM/GT/2001/U1103]